MTFPPLVLIHLLAGSIGILAGFMVFVLPKYSPAHKVAGNSFLIAMLILGLTSVYVAYTRTIFLSLLNGVFICYLLATSWVTIKRKAGSSGYFEQLALVTVMAVAIMYFTFGIQAAHSETGKLHGFAPAIFYFFGGVASLAVLLDFRMIYCGGVTGRQRIIRHVWRMCFPMFMATASFFLGQAKLFPDPVRKIELLAIPVILVLLFSGYWLLRIKFSSFIKVPHQQ
ncbi:hypothetical protein [Thalassomonas actiniarum]|uniref:DUF2306 domain-containing protein n=1 Tax=Thalassomonas actiniarum TaxID=485447 RepID=A0AAE9YRC4_9GAMM|nr:hypothetical protein [Thalassomonas actiniarum]WDD99451.1 hypothetical protein SG35_001850 [Thalassomonas actiniarum]